MNVVFYSYRRKWKPRWDIPGQTPSLKDQATPNGIFFPIVLHNGNVFKRHEKKSWWLFFANYFSCISYQYIFYIYIEQKAKRKYYIVPWDVIPMFYNAHHNHYDHPKKWVNLYLLSSIYTIQLVKLLSLSSTDTFQLVKLFLSSSTYTIQLWSLDLKTSNVKHADVLFHTANKSTISLSKTIK